MQVSSGRPSMLTSNQRGRGNEPVTVLGRIRSAVAVNMGSSVVLLPPRPSTLVAGLSQPGFPHYTVSGVVESASCFCGVRAITNGSDRCRPAARRKHDGTPGINLLIAKLRIVSDTTFN